MDRRSWPWRRKSFSDKAPAPNETESSASCPSESSTDQQDTLKSSPKSSEVASKEAQPQDSSNVKVKVLSERLSSVVSDIRAKDDLVKQHSKVAEEAVLGWEKAENELALVKNQLNAATIKNSTLDGALKECVRQLRRAKEEQDQKVQGALALQSRQWESDKTDLELRIVELKGQLEAKSERSVTSDSDASTRLAALEKENSALKAQLLAKSERDGELDALEKEKSALKAQLLAKTEELGLRTIEKELNRRAAEAASKQQLESIRKAAKLEAECRKLQATARRPSFRSDLRRTPNSLCAAESVTETDCQSDSWASALIDQYKTETRSGSLANAVDMGMNMMDDFLEMEKLAEANGRSNYAEDTGGQLVKLEDKALHELRACRHQERSAEMRRQLNLVKGEMEAAERNRRNDLEGRLELAHGEITNLLDKGRILEERLDSEKALTLELAAKYQHMDELESETKHLRAQLNSDARKYSDKITLLERRLTEECRAVQALQAKIKGADIELELAQQEIVSFQKKVCSLEQQHKALSVESAKRCHDLQAERNELTSQLQAANSHVFALNDKVNMLQETLEKQGPLVAQLESQLKSAQAESKGFKENAGLLEIKLETQKNLASAYITALDASETHKNKITNRFKLKEKEAEELHRKIYLLEEQILKERAESSEYAAQCHDLKQELCSRAPGHQPKPMASTDLHITKEKELVRAAGKLADCQKTIASLSAQLKTLSGFDEFIPGVENHDITLAENWDGDLKLFDSASYPAQLGCLAVT